MSAYVVSKEVINTLVSFLVLQNVPNSDLVSEMTPEHVEGMCLTLINENITSVNYRYQENTPLLTKWDINGEGCKIADIINIPLILGVMK